MIVKPLGDRVLIKPDPRPTQTASGLQVVEHWAPEVTGTVMSLGPDASEVKEGDYVVFSWKSGQELWLDEVRYFTMREGDILAVMNG
jgi:chaperonin GroES